MESIDSETTKAIVRDRVKQAANVSGEEPQRPWQLEEPPQRQIAIACRVVSAENRGATWLCSCEVVNSQPRAVPSQRLFQALVHSVRDPVAPLETGVAGIVACW